MKRLACCALVLAACGSHDVVIGEDYERVLQPLRNETRAIDVVFVVDDSASMQPEQQAMVASAGNALFGQLGADLAGAVDLHLAVLTTDVSTGYADAIPGCPSQGADDGRFRVGTGPGACPMIDGDYLIDVADGQGGRTQNYTGDITAAFACAATTGSQGCGFEHVFEPVRRAFDGRYPSQLGFLRPDALLLVVFLTDEDDCSVFDPAFYGDPTGGTDSPLGPRTSFRCFDFGVTCDQADLRTPGAKTNCHARDDSPYLEPIATYDAFFRSLKADPDMVMLAGMYAPPTPVAVVPDPFSPTYPALAASCATPDTQVSATPAIRVDELARRFPSRFLFQSMCDNGMSERLYRVTRAATGVMQNRGCLLGAADIHTTTDQCRGFDVAPDGTEHGVAACVGHQAGCFEIAAAADCDYTPSGLKATYVGSLLPGHHLAVDCLRPSR